MTRWQRETRNKILQALSRCATVPDLARRKIKASTDVTLVASLAHTASKRLRDTATEIDDLVSDLGYGNTDG